MEEQETDIINCPNCGIDFQADYNFCPHCGQQSKDDLTIGLLFYNTISNYFSFDARFLKSVIPLMLKPGFVARQFVMGRRLRYLHPAQYYLFVSVIFFFIFSFKVRDYNASVDKALKKGFEDDVVLKGIEPKTIDSTTAKELSEALKESQVFTGMDDKEIKELDSVIANSRNVQTPDLTFDYDKKKVDSLIAIDAPEPEILKAMGMDDDAGFFQRRFYQQILKFQKNSGGGIVQAFFDSIPIALFILLPIFALLLKIFYWRRGRYAHHLVFSFYFFSFLFIMLSVILGINFIWEIPDWIDSLVIISSFIYFWLALRHFYQQGFILSWIKASVITFIYMSIIIPIALGVMVVGSFFFY